MNRLLLSVSILALVACGSVRAQNTPDRAAAGVRGSGPKAGPARPSVDALLRGKTVGTPGGPGHPAVAGEPGNAPGSDLVIVDGGQTKAIIVVATANAGKAEKQAGDDLAKYIKLMTGVEPARASTDAEVADALKMDATHPLLIVGSAALAADPSLQQALAKAAKPNPELRADAFVLKRKGNRVYLAGTNDEAHYYAAAALLRAWGCRWYMPSEFGECIPERVPALKVGNLDLAYGSPFEVRGYWISWNGEQAGRKEFALRNFMNDVQVGGGHSLDQYTKELIPPGKTMFNVPIAEDKTAEHVAAKAAEKFAKGEDFSLGMEDGLYESPSPRDAELQAALYDKYFLSPMLTDNFMEFYNKVSRLLLKQHPQSKSHIGFLAYSNITIPPQRGLVAEKPLVASLAPIDIDPVHSMDDPRAPARQEYKAMMYRWAEVMQGRVFIYDYDQSMLVWRDIPNPVIQAFRDDVKHYRDAGILGVNTESRNGTATIFNNLYLRGQLLWDPDNDADALLADFYPNFYGPAAEPMAKYWGAIIRAWEDTIVTEHEHFVIPAIYTPALVSELRAHLEAAEKTMKEGEQKWGLMGRNWPKYQERMKFTRLSFNLIEQVTRAWRAAATDGDYKKAVEWGDKAIATRYEIADMNTTFTTRISPKMPVPESKEGGPAWMLGEVEQYRKLAAVTDGTAGKLVAKLPVEWAFHRDPNDTGLPRGWGYTPADLSYWNQHGKGLTLEQRKDYPTTEWEMIRTDLYAQAQGVLHPDWQSFTGNLWYKTEVELKPDDFEKAGGRISVRFPGLFNEAWLYVNGSMVAYRPQKPMWWVNDYAFEWDVPLTGPGAPAAASAAGGASGGPVAYLKAGKNTITLRTKCVHHFGGMFRRPFLYSPPPAAK